MCIRDSPRDVGVGQHLAHVFGQQAEQLVLDGGQVDLLAPQVDTAGGVVDLELAVFKDGPVLAAAAAPVQPAKGDPQPGQQLLHRKGLGQIVIRAGVQGVDLIGVLAPGTDVYKRQP